MNARCQICGVSTFHWTVNQAEFNVGTIRHYKIQACEECTNRIEEALIPVIALRRQAPSDETT